MSVDFMMGISQ